MKLNAIPARFVMIGVPKANMKMYLAKAHEVVVSEVQEVNE